MRLAPIVLRLRAANTTFGNQIAGASELDAAMNNTLSGHMAFVIPINEDVTANTQDNSIEQVVTERFGIIIALNNDLSQKDKTGITAYDTIHEIRSEIFRAILGWELYGAETKIYYAGAQLLPSDNMYTWYQFDFEHKIRLDEFNGYSDYIGAEDEFENQLRGRQQESQLNDLLLIYTNYMLSPSADLPYTGDLPRDDGYPDVGLPEEMAQIVNIVDDKNPGGYGRGFGSGFDFYRILNRKNDPK